MDSADMPPALIRSVSNWLSMSTPVARFSYRRPKFIRLFHGMTFCVDHPSRTTGGGSRLGRCSRSCRRRAFQKQMRWCPSPQPREFLPGALMRCATDLDKVPSSYGRSVLGGVGEALPWEDMGDLHGLKIQRTLNMLFCDPKLLARSPEFENSVSRAF